MFPEQPVHTVIVLINVGDRLGYFIAAVVIDVQCTERACRTGIAIIKRCWVAEIIGCGRHPWCRTRINRVAANGHITDLISILNRLTPGPPVSDKR